ncbi:MAG: DUF4350 domain-containing protein [Candidatus Doudnabacteria bacterium]
MRSTTVILATAGLLLLLLIAGKLSLSDYSYSPANPGWDGISAVAMDNRVVPLYSFDQLQDAGPGDKLLIIGPSVGYGEEEIRQLSDFLKNGGQAIVMDDFGTAGDLLQNLSSPILINHTPVCQDGDYYKTYSLPLARKVASDQLLDGVDVLAFNHPAMLRVTGNATELGRTSDLGWLDYNDSGTFDSNETYGAYSLVASVRYGKGELFVAGDADLLINGMLAMGDNRNLFDNIMSGGTVYLDVGHGQQMTLLAILYYVIKRDAIAQFVCASIIFIAGLSSIALGPAGKNRKRIDTGTGAKRSPAGAKEDRLPVTGRDNMRLNKR